MFPVPAHHSQGAESTSKEHVAGPHMPHRNWSTESEQPPNTVLDLLQPLTGDGSLKLGVVANVRKELQEAIHANKDTTHKLVLENYPAISHHIRTSAEVHKELESVSKEIQQLERQIENGGSSSLLPPLLAFLEEHSSHAQAHTKASARLRTLKSVSERRDAVLKLEKAIWSGHGADVDVLEQLQEASVVTAGGTRVGKIITERVRALKSLVTGQLISTFHRVISFSTENNSGPVMTVTRAFSLERSQLTKSVSAPRPFPKDTGDAPVVQISQLFDALKALGELEQLLASVQKVLLKSIVLPLLPSHAIGSKVWSLEDSSSEMLAMLRLVPAEEDATSPSHVLGNLEKVYTFSNAQIPSPTFQQSLRAALFSNTLDSIILHSIPDQLITLPNWLETTRLTVEFEQRISSGDERPLKDFAGSQAVQTWAQRRRRMLAEATRNLIDGPAGWRGWDGNIIQRKTEVTEFVEVQVEVTEDVGSAVGAEDDGWGFEADGSPTALTSKVPEVPPSDAMLVDDGWSFDESAETRTDPQAESSAPSEEDGWDFDDSAIPAPVPVIPKKPVREARKLGKLKSKAQKSASPTRSSPRSSFDLPTSPMQQAPVEDDWSTGWEEQSSPKKSKTEVQRPRQMRTEVQERKRMVEEPLLVSVACQDIVQTARQVLQDSVELPERIAVQTSEDLESPQATLRDSARDVFDLYRSLMPLTFGRQLRDVPSIAMQLYNDCNHLADQVGELKLEFDAWAETSVDLENRLRSFGVRSFDAQISMQKESLAESIREADGFVNTVDDMAFRKCERGSHQVTHKLESLDRVWRGVLAPSTRQEVMGQLVDSAVSLMASNILALVDITELESNRIGELCKLMHPLDQLFMAGDSDKSTIVAMVPHWLKFCYVIELMQASLVDILYLFDTGALVDFETDEIINLIRALFAETQQRANAVDHIQGGRPDVA